jgi:hypothetical protein
MGGAAAFDLGCGSGSDSDSGADAGPASVSPEEDAGLVGNDPDATTARAGIGSPLCGVTGITTCMPDDDGSRHPMTTTKPCVGDAGASASACRVVAPSSTDCFTAAPGTPPVAYSAGLDGTSCKEAADCAPGFDCVTTDKGGGVCRHYCCSRSTCDKQTAQNGSPTFCDIEELFTGSTLDGGGQANAPKVPVPVCMPIKKCKLLMPGECTAQETCAIVTDKGDTGCVRTGPALEGQSCDEEGCSAGLTCLGNAGDRRCYKLCQVDGNDCGSSKTCTTGTVFQDTSYGVCKAPM